MCVCVCGIMRKVSCPFMSHLERWEQCRLNCYTSWLNDSSNELQQPADCLCCRQTAGQTDGQLDCQQTQLALWNDWSADFRMIKMGSRLWLHFAVEAGDDGEQPCEHSCWIWRKQLPTCMQKCKLPKHTPRDRDRECATSVVLCVCPDSYLSLSGYLAPTLAISCSFACCLFMKQVT